MVRSLSFCLFTLLILVLFSMSETRVLEDNNPSPTHFLSGSLFFSTVKQHINGGFEHRRLSANKVSYSIGFRDGDYAKTRKYKPQRVSPGGPDGHHHFKNINVGKMT